MVSQFLDNDGIGSSGGDCSLRSDTSMSKDMVTCRACGWVHFKVSRKYATDQVKQFNEYYASLGEKAKEDYNSPSSIESYEQCFYCGGSYKNFRAWKQGDSPDGCTIQPIMDKKD